MSARAAINPQVISMPSPQGLPLVPRLAANSATWKRGEFGYLTSGTVTPVVNSGITTPYCIFADTQATATSTSTVNIYILQLGMVCAFYLTSSTTVQAWSDAYRGVRYGVYGVSNVTYLDINTTSGAWEVIGPMSVVQPESDARLDMDGVTATSPCLVLAQFKGVL